MKKKKKRKKNEAGGFRHPASDYTTKLQDFPRGPVVKILPANAGDTCLSPVPEKIPHAKGPLSLFITTTEARTLESLL